MAQGGPNISLPSTNGYHHHLQKSTSTAFIASKAKKNSSCSHIEQQTTDLTSLLWPWVYAETWTALPIRNFLSQKRHKWKRQCLYSVSGGRLTSPCILFCFSCWMYYSVIPKTWQGRGWHAGDGWGFSCVPERVLKRVRGRLRMPFSEDHYSDLNGAGYASLLHLHHLKKTTQSSVSRCISQGWIMQITN